MGDVSAELVGGPWDRQTGRLSFKDEPPLTLAFNLGEKGETTAGLIIPTSASVHDKLTALYVRIEEKPRKVITYDDNGRARSERGVRYRYDPTSPVEELIKRADTDALLTADAIEHVRSTRRLLLEEAQREREGARS